MATDLPIFRREFKRYKRRNPAPDLSDVIHFDREESWKGRVKISSSRRENDVCDHDVTKFGLKEIHRWKCFALNGYEGFQVIANPFTSAGQRGWIEKCVKIYPAKPNVCNLDAHMERCDRNLWVEYEQDYLSGNRGVKTTMDQLRWVTLGYHYNWDTKKYSKENHTPFPDDLKELCAFFARTLGFESFTPEAAIVNYYHMDSTLSGHTDHSELDLTAPLFSISFGQTCVFLLGGPTLDHPPCAILLHSGDVVVMSRDSRQAYHGVPKILRDDNVSSILIDENEDEVSRDEILRSECLMNYLSYSRININIRQVEGPQKRFK